MSEYVSTRANGRQIILRDAPEPRALDHLPETEVIRHGLQAWKKSMERAIAVFKARFELADIDPGVEAEVMHNMVIDEVEKAAEAEVRAMAPTSREFKAIAKIATEAFNRDPEIRKRVEKRLTDLRQGITQEMRRRMDPGLEAAPAQKNERSHLDAERAILDDRRDTEPGFLDAKTRPAEQHEIAPVGGVDHGVSKMVEILKAATFESDGPLADYGHIAVYVMEKSQHRIELNEETGRFRAVSGWDNNVATGEGPEDLTQWLQEEN